MDDAKSAEQPIDAGNDPLPTKLVDLDMIEQSVRMLLTALGQDSKTEVKLATPRRVAEMYGEIINPSNVDIEKDFKLFDNPGIADLIIVNDVHYVSICEHHLAPTFGVAHVAYVPDKFIVGYSKLKKALNYLARQPQLNERLVVDCLDFISARLQPKGIAVVLRSVHCCMVMRSNAPMQEIVTVSDFRGLLRKDPYRGQFWDTVLASKPIFVGA